MSILAVTEGSLQTGWVTLAIAAVAFLVYRQLRSGKKHDSLGTIFLGLVGAAAVVRSATHVQMTVVEETIVLVIFLGGLMGISHVKMPRLKQAWQYPIVSGVISAIMDSFLVLLMVKKLTEDKIVTGSKEEIRDFWSYNMAAALIGGLMIYFGEVYALPLYLKYDLKGPLSCLPIVPPVLVFLGILAWQTRKLKSLVVQPGSNGHGSLDQLVTEQNPAHQVALGQHPTKEDYAEFALGIAFLLATHNTLMSLGMLLLYASLTGQGDDLIHTVKMETEVDIMLLLFLAWLLEKPIAPLMQSVEGFVAFIPASINAVIFGALYPISGDVWREITILSTAALLTPVSSLVGVMLFKSGEEWKAYMKKSIPLCAIWFALAMAWFELVWKR